jgi:acetyl-CoA carboxylase biotin carboxylase subunit
MAMASPAFGERDCSVQRRYQKLVEEAPCAAMPDHLRAQLPISHGWRQRQLSQRGHGRVPLRRRASEFYFIEVNARIQVEHPSRK